jgi:nucleotide-binding universal stress UspA family protein/4-amino-4-deoxy-L-arabinose transferase-like glycosyltransferase
LLPFVLASLAGTLVVAIAVFVFPHLSHNHDEAVYLQQAALLLDGQLQYHAGPIADAVHPWFFVRDGGRLYPKYSPVPAAVFAIGMALGSPRLSLGLIAAGNAVLVYALTRAAFDRRTATLAVVFLVGSPLFLFTSATFLPYATTTLSNLAFAFAYVRAARRSSLRWAVLAGAAIGLAFFARPYTAVLFAAPFVVHAGWSTLAAARSRRDGGSRRSVLVRQVAIAAVGLGGVAVALAYNRVITGDPLLFPYEAFAPLDGLGFGRRKLLGHELQYTPALALRSTGRLLWEFLTRWTAAGVLGSIAAAAGVAVTVRDLRGRRWRPSPTDLGDRTLRVLLLGLLTSVTLGNVYFWGTVNVLGDPTDSTDGLIAFLGPFYHFDLLLPLSAFGAVGTLAVARAVVDRVEGALSPRRSRAILLALLVVATPTALAAEAAVLRPPMERNLAYTDAYDRAYDPFENRNLENALVFAPQTYDDWLAHPFQRFRNAPGLDGPVVYAIDRGGRNFAVVDASPNRTYYRYTYRGEWLGEAESRLTPALQRLRVRKASRIEATTTVGVPDDAVAVVVRLSNDATAARYRLADASVNGVRRSGSASEIPMSWAVEPSGVRLENSAGWFDREAGPRTLPIDGNGTIAVTITVHAEQGATLTYRQEVSVRVTGDRVAVLWPPRQSVCTLVRQCGYEGTYLPGRSARPPDAVRFRTSISTAPDRGRAADPSSVSDPGNVLDGRHLFRSMYETILVPTDGSDPAAAAVDHAVDVASKYGATVHGLYVGRIGDAPPGLVDQEIASDPGGELGQEALDLVGERAEAAGVEYVERYVPQGSVADAILAYVEEEAVDLVVMGTHGRSGIDRLVVGSVAEQVVRESPVPVMTVRSAADGND